MIYFGCTVCRTMLSAGEEFAGKLMRCPTCMSAQRVPAPEAVAAATPSPGPAPKRELRLPAAVPPSLSKSGGRRYGFHCPYCSSRLEASEGHAGTSGQCPTCGSSITIPIQDRFGRLIDPNTREIIKPDPHPVHAYAAAGERAPRVIRASDGSQQIQCSRCGTLSAVRSNNCRSCGMPFTMEGTTAEAMAGTNGYCVASLVLGVISIPAFCTIVLPALAILFGVIGYNQVSNSSESGGGRGMAIAGIVCGSIAGLMALMAVWT